MLGNSRRSAIGEESRDERETESSKRERKRERGRESLFHGRGSDVSEKGREREDIQKMSMSTTDEHQAKKRGETIYYIEASSEGYRERE